MFKVLFVLLDGTFAAPVVFKMCCVNKWWWWWWCAAACALCPVCWDGWQHAQPKKKNTHSALKALPEHDFHRDVASVWWLLFYFFTTAACGQWGGGRTQSRLCVFLFPLPFFVSFFKQAHGITVTASCKWRGTSRSFPRPPRCGCLGSNESPRGGAMTFLELLPTARGRQPTWVCSLEPRHYFSCPAAWHDLEQVASRCVRIVS